MTIAKEFTFDSSHNLPDEECYGKCGNLHGHTYKLIVEITGEVNNKGWIMNFVDLKKIVNEKVINKLDHKHINNFVPLSTAENIINWIYLQIKDDIEKFDIKITNIILWETPTSYAKLNP